MKVHVLNEQDDLIVDAESIILIVESVIKNEGARVDEVAIHFIEDQKMRELHDLFFHDSSSTDCISFPIDIEEDEPYRVLGDVFVCPATAYSYGKKHDISPYQELTLYIVHGLLHLLGYDDIEEEEIMKMRSAEQRHMQRLEEQGRVLNAPKGGTT